MEWLALMPDALVATCAVSRMVLLARQPGATLTDLEHELDLSEGHAAAASDWCTA